MVATGREPTLPPDLTSDTGPAPAAEDTPEYVKTIRQRLQLTHQQMTAPPAAPSPNPYREGSLVYVLTTPPERTSKLAPRWKGPFHVCRIPNDYQVTYEDDGVERTVHVNHVKSTKFAAPDLAEPVPPVESPRPQFGYLHACFAHEPIKPPNLPAAPVEAPMAPITSPAAPEVPIATPPPVAPAVPPPKPALPHRRSLRLHPEQGQAQAILSRPTNCSPASQPQSKPRPRAVNSSSCQCSRMARVHPLTVGYTEAVGPKANPLSFASLRLVDLPNGRSQYLNTPETRRRSPRDRRSSEPLRSPRPPHPPRTTPPLPNHEGHDLVSPTFGWDVYPRLLLPSLLLGTPGTACDFKRG